VRGQFALHGCAPPLPALGPRRLTYVIAGGSALREAVNAVNNGDPLIQFNFAVPAGPGGVWTIELQDPLPAINRKVVIDGYANGVSTANTDATGSNADINVEITAAAGGKAAAGTGLELNGTASELRGVSITGFSTGVRLKGITSVVEGCFIGLTADGRTAKPNAIGIEVQGLGHRIGAAQGQITFGARNLISGNGKGGAGAVNYDGTGILVTGERHSIAGNLIGTDRSGIEDRGNKGDGVLLLNAHSTTIGGRRLTPDTARNVISDNKGNGIRITGIAARQNRVLNNLIGVGANGTDAEGNSLDGIRFQEGASFNLVGATADSKDTDTTVANSIRFNAERGISVEGDNSISNTFRLNSIDDNGNIGIDLNRDGVTQNDVPPGQLDKDLGPNLLQNFPTIGVGPNMYNPKSTYASGVVQSIPGEKWYIVDIYLSPTRDPSGHGEGRQYLATEIAIPDPAKPGEYIWGYTVPPGTSGFLSTTATRPSTLDTSEFSGAAAVNTSATTVVPQPTKVAVTSPNDSGTGTLRAAINFANTTPGPQEIVFNLPGGGPHTISLGAPLPDITDELVIAGQSQSGYVNQPVILLDGNGGVYHALRAVAPTQVGGLAFANFRGDAALRLAGTGGHVVGGNYFGTEITGTFIRSNRVGILAEPGSNSNDIFGNVISGNVGRGVELRSNGNRLERNLIGPRANGSPLGNFDDGVYVAGSFNLIGSDIPTAGNTISGNGGAGVVIATGTSNRIGINVIDLNSDQPIDLGDDGFTDNDMLDIDGGANLRQNFAQLEAAMKESGTVILGELVSQANTAYRVDFYSSDGSGGGGRWLGFANLSTDAFGSATIGLELGELVEAGQSLSAVVTDDGGNSSEFSPATIVFDTRKPQISSMRFDLSRCVQVLDVAFSEEVGDSLEVSDFNVSKVGGGVVPIDFFEYDAHTQTAHLYFQGALADGNYRLTMAASDVRDFAFNPLQGNFAGDFRVLAGDATGDGRVDVADLGILASNWQKTGRVFSQGDFDRSGTVDVNDLGILASRWQQALAAPSSPVAQVFSAKPRARIIDTML
jgi:hypothetical protein